MTAPFEIDASSPIAKALKSASRSTGAGFDYLLTTAMRESSLNPTAKAPTSSATGLFQFIESTWLETVKAAGPRHGLADVADKIQVRADGKHVVSDPTDRREILALRKDPEIASAMAGELTARNAAHLKGALGRSPSEAELYMAHFMGAGGATRLISLAENTPQANAVQQFPSEARANRSIFMNRDGSARSVSDVYERLGSHHADTQVTWKGTPDAAPRQRTVFDLLGFFSNPAERSAQPAGAGAVSSTSASDNAALYTGGKRAGPLQALFQGLFGVSDDAEAVSIDVSRGLFTARDGGQQAWAAYQTSSSTGLFAASGLEAQDELTAPLDLALAASGADLAAETSAEAERPAKRPAAVDRLVEQWAASSGNGAPLDLLEAARLYQSNR